MIIRSKNKSTYYPLSGKQSSRGIRLDYRNSIGISAMLVPHSDWMRNLITVLSIVVRPGIGRAQTLKSR
jgi:hypothetical protein